VQLYLTVSLNEWLFVVSGLALFNLPALSLIQMLYIAWCGGPLDHCSSDWCALWDAPCNL